MLESAASLCRFCSYLVLVVLLLINSVPFALIPHSQSKTDDVLLLQSGMDTICSGSQENKGREDKCLEVA